MKAISLLLLLGACASHEPDPIREVILTRMPQYEQCLKTSKTFLTGKEETWALRTRFLINPDGSVTEPVILSSSVEDFPFQHCVRNELLLLKFPPRTATVEVFQPLNFHRGSMK